LKKKTWEKTMVSKIPAICQQLRARGRGVQSSNTPLHLSKIPAICQQFRARARGVQSSNAPLHQMNQFAAKMLQSTKLAQETIKTSFWNAGTTINKVIGYDLVEKLKVSVFIKEQQVVAKKNEFITSKSDYELIIEQTRQCQKDIDHLRDRKMKSIDEITKITKLYEKQLALEEEEVKAKNRYKQATDQFEKAQMEYLSTMRERYVEEQMFSDKIRQTSTWWTWALMSTHLVLFLIVQLFTEPRKERRLKSELGALILDSNLETRRTILDDFNAVHLTSKAGSFNPDVDTKPALAPKEESFFKDVDTKPALAPKEESFFKSVLFWQGISIGAVTSTVIVAFLK
jgi:sensitive to high expression protein 9